MTLLAYILVAACLLASAWLFRLCWRQATRSDIQQQLMEQEADRPHTPLYGMPNVDREDRPYRG